LLANPLALFLPSNSICVLVQIRPLQLEVTSGQMLGDTLQPSELTNDLWGHQREISETK
jgi:hypothetical protein